MDQEVFFLMTVSFGHKDAFIELAPVLMGSNPKDISVTDIFLDHEPGSFLKNHCLCHEHSPPKFSLS
jgi:hypothetical protein